MTPARWLVLAGLAITAITLLFAWGRIEVGESHSLVDLEPVEDGVAWPIVIGLLVTVMAQFLPWPAWLRIGMTGLGCAVTFVAGIAVFLSLDRPGFAPLAAAFGLGVAAAGLSIDIGDRFASRDYLSHHRIKPKKGTPSSTEIIRQDRDHGH